MSNYILELSIIHLVLILGYWIFLRQERQYAKMRFYLIGATLLSLTIPLLKLPKLLFNNVEPLAVAPVGTIQLEAMSITTIPESSGFDFSWLIWTYAAITIFFLIKFLGSVGYLVYLERKSSYEKFNDLYIRKVKNINGSFTFFNWIFLSEEVDKSQQDYDVILRHEQAHASLGHSYDLVLFELFKVCFWWLPSSWFINKEIKKIHEYQADAYALKSYNVERYSSILISSTLKSNGLSLASSFHDGLILKRLLAMKQQTKKVSPWKLGALSMICATLFVVFACSEEVDQEIKKMGSQSNLITFDQLPADMQVDLVEIKEDLSFMKVEILEGDKMSNIEELQDLDPKTIHSMNVDKANKAIYIAIKKDGTNFDYLSEKSKQEGEVFTIVEEQPEFEGGIDAFYQYLGNEIKYPEQAREMGVEGRVYVQFVVETDGSLSEVKSVKGIGAGCDTEAVRVVQNAPAFKPGSQRGKPVRVRMVMPIAFTLDPNMKNTDNSKERRVLYMRTDPQNGQLKVDAQYGYTSGQWSGTVYSSEGKVLPGANIVVAGTNRGTVSNLEGQFKVAASESEELDISFIGYESVRLKVK
ncbi:MAG: TonB family protein [Marinoscillum sp.]|jgi:TonB family protein